MVFISPRSFCSGVHFKNYRKWLLNNLQIEYVHVFESRKAVFDRYDVQQEIIIMKTRTLQKLANKETVISKSTSKSFDDFQKISVKQSLTRLEKSDDVLIQSTHISGGDQNHKFT